MKRLGAVGRMEPLSPSIMQPLLSTEMKSCQEVFRKENDQIDQMSINGPKNEVVTVTASQIKMIRNANWSLYLETLQAASPQRLWIFEMVSMETQSLLLSPS